MIIVRLMGGIGNQMFQYAFGMHLAYLNGSELKMDLSFLNAPPKGVTKRKYELGVYNIDPKIADAEELKNISPKGALAVLFLIAGKKSYKYIEEGPFGFRPEMLQLRGDIYLHGYWQSEKYFKDIEGHVRDSFSFKKGFDPAGKSLLDRMRSSCSVGVHIRRGDYVSAPATNKFHGLCGIDYYKRAAALIGEKCADPVFFVFSDDIDWAKENIKFLGDSACFVDGNQERAGEDMRLFSCCKHNITANSSFSWWGAWLNLDPDKIVVTPKKWFADESRNAQVRDLIPEKWISI